MEYIDVKHPISLLMLQSAFTTLKGTIPLLRGGRGSVYVAMSGYRQIKFGDQIF